MNAPAPSFEELTKASQRAAFASVLAYFWNPSEEAFGKVVRDLRLHLREAEQQTLMELVVSSMPPGAAEEAAARAFRGAGYPVPTLGEDALSDARWWAENANAAEIGAYAKACAEKMSPERRAAFVKHVEAMK